MFFGAELFSQFKEHFRNADANINLNLFLKKEKARFFEKIKRKKNGCLLCFAQKFANLESQVQKETK